MHLERRAEGRTGNRSRLVFILFYLFLFLFFFELWRQPGKWRENGKYNDRDDRPTGDQIQVVK